MLAEYNKLLYALFSMAIEQTTNIGDSQPTPPDLRKAFIEEIIRPTGVSEEIIAAFASVDRAEFSSVSQRGYAYTDKILTLGRESSISQPSLVARMIAIVDPKPGDNTLEIGTATGYQASVLSQIVGHVDTIEINPNLAEQAKKNIKRLGYDEKITVHEGDGIKGIQGKNFDNIIVTAALKNMPQALLDQLAMGGIMVAPVGLNLDESILTVYKKDEKGEVKTHELGACYFVHIKTDEASGWAEGDIAKADKKHYIRSVINHLRRIGKLPEQEIDRLQTDMARVVGCKEPLTEDQIIKILKLVSDTMTPELQEPVFE